MTASQAQNRISSQEKYPLPSNSSNSIGRLEGKKVAKWQKPLSIALVILGILGASAAGAMALACLGGVSSLSQIYAIATVSAGGIGGTTLFIIGVVLLVKAHHQVEHNNARAPSPPTKQGESTASTEQKSDDPDPEKELKNLLKDNTFGILPPSEGSSEYRLVQNQDGVKETYLHSESKVEEAVELKLAWNYHFYSDKQEDLIATVVNRDTLENKLVPGSNPLALQNNGNYTALWRPLDGEIQIQQDVSKADLKELIIKQRREGHKYVGYRNLTLMSNTEIKDTLQQDEYTCVLQFDGNYKIFYLWVSFRPDTYYASGRRVTLTTTDAISPENLQKALVEWQEKGTRFIRNFTIEDEYDLPEEEPEPPAPPTPYTPGKLHDIIL